MEEYVKTLLEQIRCEKAHPLVEAEIRGHFEDQIEENLLFGMTQEEAMKAAVKDMGDPVEAGVSLDRIHRPQISWSMVIIIGIISLASIFLQFLLADGRVHSTYNYFFHHLIYTVFGFLMMIAVYRIDYSILGKYGKRIGGCFFVFLVLMSFGFGAMFNGSIRFAVIGGRSINLSILLYLFLPIYGGILYQYRGNGYKGILKSILWMIFPVLFAFEMPNLSLAVSLFFMMVLLLSITVSKGWFQIHKKRFLVSLWSTILLLPVVLLALAMNLNWLKEYQKLRLQAIIAQDSVSYITETLRKIIHNSKLIGFSSELVSDDSLMYASDYVLASITAYYGFFIAIVVIALMMLLVCKIFRISFHQKNQLGMIVGYSCGIVFATITIFNILCSFGILLPTYTILPFFSYGGSANIIFYMLIGLVLSIYRYKSILPNKTINKSIA